MTTLVVVDRRFLPVESFENKAVGVDQSLKLTALGLAKDGYKIFPVKRGDKAAALRRWEVVASNDPFKVDYWWTRWPYNNIGIACGPSGLVVVDLDPPKGKRSQDGRQVFWDLIKKHGIPWEPTRRIRTPSGGVHLYYRAPADANLKTSAGRLGPGIDTRAIGGYVVGPASVTPAGRYEVEVAGPIRDLPQPLVELLRTPVVERREPMPIRGDISAYAAGAMRNELERLADAAEGTRNATLNSVAYRLGRLVGSGVIDREQVEKVLLAQGVGIGLSEGECVATIRSGLDAGELRPNPLITRS